MLCSMVILFAVVIFLLCFHSYARCLFERRQRNRRRSRHHRFLRNANSNFSALVPPQGLDLSVLKKIPTFIYSSSTEDDEAPLECAVCLSGFEYNEKGRVLPKCNHAFHVDCIDMWFHSHSNCPLCRAPVQIDAPVQPRETTSEETISANEPADSSSRDKKDGDLDGSSSSLPPERVSIVVETP